MHQHQEVEIWLCFTSNSDSIFIFCLSNFFIYGSIWNNQRGLPKNYKAIWEFKREKWLSYSGLSQISRISTKDGNVRREIVSINQNFLGEWYWDYQLWLQILTSLQPYGTGLTQVKAAWISKLEDFLKNGIVPLACASGNDWWWRMIRSNSNLFCRNLLSEKRVIDLWWKAWIKVKRVFFDEIKNGKLNPSWYPIVLNFRIFRLLSIQERAKYGEDIKNLRKDVNFNLKERIDAEAIKNNFMKWRKTLKRKTNKWTRLECLLKVKGESYTINAWKEGPVVCRFMNVWKLILQLL